MGQHKIKRQNRHMTMPAVLGAPYDLSVPSLSLEGSVAKFAESFQHRSFSHRNPELGKMIKCASCGHRHRSYECPQHFATTIRQEGKQVPCEPRVSPLPRTLRMPVNLYWRPKPNKQVDLMLYQLRKQTKEVQAAV